MIVRSNWTWQNIFCEAQYFTNPSFWPQPLKCHHEYVHKVHINNTEDHKDWTSMYHSDKASYCSVTKQVKVHDRCYSWWQFFHLTNCFYLSLSVTELWWWFKTVLLTLVGQQCITAFISEDARIPNIAYTTLCTICYNVHYHFYHSSIWSKCAEENLSILARSVFWYYKNWMGK